MAATLVKIPPLTEGAGVTLQLVPSKCSARVPPPLPPLVAMSPTAQISSLAMAAAAVRLEFLINGLGTTCRFCPSALSAAIVIAMRARNVDKVRARGVINLGRDS